MQQYSKNEFKSGLERRFSKILEKYELNYTTQYKLYYEKDRYKTYDFHISGSNILIEVQGDFFHGNPIIFKKQNSMQRKASESDSFKKKLAYESEFLLIEFWQRELQRNPIYVETIISQINELREPEPPLKRFL